MRILRSLVVQKRDLAAGPALVHARAGGHLHGGPSIAPEQSHDRAVAHHAGVLGRVCPVLLAGNGDFNEAGDHGTPSASSTASMSVTLRFSRYPTHLGIGAAA